MRPYSSTRYLRALLGLTGTALAAIAAVNLTVDPFNAYPGTHLESLADFRNGRGTRSGKAELLRQGGYANLIMGSSRVEMGIDPSHASWPAGGTLNAGLVGSSFYEHPFVWRIADEQRALKRVYLFLDFYMFGLPSMGKADMQRSRLNPETSMFTYHLENMVGLHASKKTLSSLLCMAKGTDAATDPRGFRSGDHVKSPDGVRAMTAQILRSITAPHNLSGFTYNEQSVESLAQLLQDVRESGRELVVAIAPKHVMYNEALFQLGLWDEWETWKRDVVELVAQADAEVGGAATPVWDFTLYGERSTEFIPGDPAVKQLENFVEITHFNTTFGNEVIEVLLGEREAGDMGALVDGSNLDDHLALLRGQRAEWVADHRDEVRFVRESVYQGGLAVESTLARGEGDTGSRIR